jgi:hypothetical protein
VPRELVQLIGNKDEQKIQVVETGKDWAMFEFSKRKVLQILEQNICGFIFQVRGVDEETRSNSEGFALLVELKFFFFVFRIYSFHLLVEQTV